MTSKPLRNPTLTFPLRRSILLRKEWQAANSLKAALLVGARMLLYIEELERSHPSLPARRDSEDLVVGERLARRS